MCLRMNGLNIIFQILFIRLPHLSNSSISSFSNYGKPKNKTSKCHNLFCGATLCTSLSVSFPISSHTVWNDQQLPLLLLLSFVDSCACGHANQDHLPGNHILFHFNFPLSLSYKIKTNVCLEKVFEY